MAVGIQPKTRRQLLGVFEVHLQRIRQTIAGDGDDPLIALRTVVRFQSHGQIARAEQVADGSGAAAGIGRFGR